jgi:hypothetical protein
LPLRLSPDHALRHLLTLADALLEVFSVVVVTSEAFEDFCDARLPALQPARLSHVESGMKAVSVAPSLKLQMMAL